MKKLSFTITTVICFFLLYSCGYNVEFENLDRLNGYWEIKEVKRPDGKNRDYKFSETVDYIKIDSLNHGIRKKMKATVSGKYKTTPRIERFEVKKEDDSLRLYYKTEMDDWKETLVQLDKDRFAVRNERGIIYIYQRFNGFIDDGKE
jgi:hypothetical protein